MSEKYSDFEHYTQRGQNNVPSGGQMGVVFPNVSIVRNLKAMGFQPTDIAKATGLSLDEIAKLFSREAVHVDGVLEARCAMLGAHDFLE